MGEPMYQDTEYRTRLAEGVRGAFDRTVPNLDGTSLGELMRE